ncbi:MAG TPA: DUF2089 domain-containing protein [Chloroflexota bacterium]|nr:DUF2089 domain-containing protein [Chloroflexota bacterium]
MRKLLEYCPSCGGEIEVSGLHCNSCGTDVNGHFAPCQFCRLTPDQSTFLLMFVQSRGNLTELEKNLGVSYPTVRAKLDEIIGQLGGDRARTGRGDRRGLLERVAAGELSPNDGLSMLRQIDTEAQR